MSVGRSHEWQSTDRTGDDRIMRSCARILAEPVNALNVDDRIAVSIVRAEHRNKDFTLLESRHERSIQDDVVDATADQTKRKSTRKVSKDRRNDFEFRERENMSAILIDSPRRNASASNDRSALA